MPTIVKELTNLQVKNIGLGTYAVGGVRGLYIKTTETTKFFFLRYTNIKGKRRDYRIGSYPECSLKEARALAIDAKKLVSEGKDPVDIRREWKIQMRKAEEPEPEPVIVRFGDVANEWVADRARNGFWSRNVKGEKETRQILAKHVFPLLGDMDIEKIEPKTIRECMAPIWQVFPSTAKKARTYIQKIFQWAIAKGRRQKEVNPADMQGALGILMEPLQKNRKSKRHFPSCPFEQIPDLMAHIRAHHSISARALEFSILTATRSKAVRLATWDQINLEQGIWVIPVENDKIKNADRDRTIFLSRQAVKLLKELPRDTSSPYVFTSMQGVHLSDDALRMFIRGLHDKKCAEDGIGWIDPIMSKREGSPCIITAHGTARSSFRTWAKDDVIGNNRRFDQEAVEMCLLHAKNDAYNGAYDRAPLAKERRKIMEAWGRYCHSLKK